MKALIGQLSHPAEYNKAIGGAAGALAGEVATSEAILDLCLALAQRFEWLQSVVEALSAHNKEAVLACALIGLIVSPRNRYPER